MDVTFVNGRMTQRRMLRGEHMAVCPFGCDFFNCCCVVAAAVSSSCADAQSACWTVAFAISRRASVLGDGANDLSMMATAGMGVAFHAKPAVRAASPIEVTHCGLDGVCYLLGSEGEFASD